ncbi:hypothetical protein C8A01DRAFT_48269 [Parachaetomium inaequale]|uniref:Uncharacterized protein n=1 Tax=Parachaetomium inaequale TaxID=2588326 RepID=A0AAN6PBV9_9PEZI|nr:hypothetical protein C8A01DRAFT_48269 [Parachaetomium inaequale]
MPPPSPNSSETPVVVPPSELEAPMFELSHGLASPESTRTRDQNLKFNEDLKIVPIEIDASTRAKLTRKTLKAVDDAKNFLPGQPRVRLDDEPSYDKDPLLEYLDGSHNTNALDDLLLYMRYMQSYEHIITLHHQRAHAREIKVAEDPGLHLVSFYEIIFEYLENVDRKLHSACIGFMRSYYMLIRYKIDFEDACQLRLIPEKGNGQMPTYEEWCKFIVPFARVGNQHVNRRYHYGELRLTRINIVAMCFRSGLAYYQYRIHLDWGSFMEHTLGPVVTVFAVCTVVLNSMQVGLAAITMVQTPPDAPWSGFVNVSVWFPVVVLVGIALLLILALVTGCARGKMMVVMCVLSMVEAMGRGRA